MQSSKKNAMVLRNFGNRKRRNMSIVALLRPILRGDTVRALAGSDEGGLEDECRERRGLLKNWAWRP